VNEQGRLWNHLQTRRLETFVVNRHRLDAVARLATARARRTGRALDVGIGQGYLVMRLRERGFAAMAADASAESLKAFRKRGSHVALVATDAGALGFRDAAFDLVTASELFEHLAVETLAAAVDEIRRVLRPGGVLVATVPAEERLSDALCFCPRCGNEFHRYGHQQTFDRDRLLALLRPRFPVVTIRRRYVSNPGLNWIGWLSWAAKSVLARFRPVRDATFFVVASTA
jgi:SAM-dependent methyltransferase